MFHLVYKQPVTCKWFRTVVWGNRADPTVRSALQTVSPYLGRVNLSDSHVPTRWRWRTNINTTFAHSTHLRSILLRHQYTRSLRHESILCQHKRTIMSIYKWILPNTVAYGETIWAMNKLLRTEIHFCKLAVTFPERTKCDQILVCWKNI